MHRDAGIQDDVSTPAISILDPGKARLAMTRLE